MRIPIGKIGRPHGIDGSFFVEQPSDDARWWKTGATFLAGGQRVEVVAHRTASGRPVIKLDPPAERGAPLEVERDELPATEEDEYYAFELVGLAVVEENGRELGTVEAVNPGIANDVLVLTGGVLLPMVEDCIKHIDLDAQRIEIAVGFAE
jgi:16S rRNA processing protein RimM